MTKGKDTDKTAKAKNKGGRPTLYTPELAAKICRAIATCTESLQHICDDNEGFPKSKSTVHEWRYDNPKFAAMYTLAKQQQADLIAEELLEISDNGLNDWMERHGEDNEGWIVNGEAIARSRLRVDTRKWIACKLLPKVYGDKSLDTPQGGASSEQIKEIADAIKELNAKHEREY